MTTIRLFGNDIKVAEKKEEKSIMLFGTRIFQSPANNSNDRFMNMSDLPPRSMCLSIESFHGSRPVYVGWKYLENSDINANLSRFLIPVECYSKLLYYMSKLEREKVLNKDDRGINVSVIDPKGNLHDMKFTGWKSLGRLVFNRGWNNLVRDNQFKKGDLLELWHFRMPNNKPCFAINIIRY
ncbi:B3 domain-containing protein At2g32645-like [Solanum pennellii]|uniref:B3 domain-containing protein At2g32645-like n=1 Tax=Solanum pennellii TaxID=28526 RepID=A0ABM1H7L3_SOLPN|nr:B3 domain-containing protein At2g32645-like [Solanum pennellii]